MENKERKRSGLTGLWAGSSSSGVGDGAPRGLSPELLQRRLEQLQLFCQRFQANPTLHVAGLNPHAGEAGQLGQEEVEWITPLLQRLRRGKGSNAGRVVFDLDGPVFVQRLGSDLLLDLRSNPGQQRLLRTLGLQPRQTENYHIFG